MTDRGVAGHAGLSRLLQPRSGRRSVFRSGKTDGITAFFTSTAAKKQSSWQHSSSISNAEMGIRLRTNSFVESALRFSMNSVDRNRYVKCNCSKKSARVKNESWHLFFFSVNRHTWGAECCGWCVEETPGLHWGVWNILPGTRLSSVYCVSVFEQFRNQHGHHSDLLQTRRLPAFPCHTIMTSLTATKWNR